MANVIKHKRGSGSDPSASNLVIGELAIRTDNGKLFTKMDSGAIAEIAGGGSDIAINTLSSSSATGGGSATFNGSAYRFTLSSPPSVSAQQLLVSINGVIQKPVAGTGQPSEGFSVDGTDIILGDAPATGSDFFILTFRSLGVSEPADNSVTSAKIADGAIVNADINASAAIDASKLSGVLPLTAGSGNPITGALFIESATPTIIFTDTNNNPDYQVNNADGVFRIRDNGAGANRVEISSSAVDVNLNLTVDNGTSSTIRVEADSGGEALFLATGGSGAQATAAIELMQSTTSLQGGGISYNGDGNPAWASGETADHITFYRRINGVRHEVFSYPYNSSNVVFNGTVTATSFSGSLGANNLTGTIPSSVQSNITQIGTLGSLTVSGGSNPVNFTHTGANCVTFNRNGKTLSINANFAAQNNFSNIALTSGMDLRFSLGGQDRIDFKSAGHIEPVTDSQINLGADAKRFANVYADTLYGDGSNLTGISSVGGSTGVDFNDNVKARFGTGNDLELFFDGTHSRLKHTPATGDLVIQSDDIYLTNAAGDEHYFRGTQNGAVELYHDHVKKFATQAYGIALNDQMIQDCNGINSGGEQFRMVIPTGTSGGFRVLVRHADGSLAFNDSIANFYSTQIQFLKDTQSRRITPEVNNTYDLGSTSQRWRNVYTNDLNLSNEGGANDVDGTWGSYTIQEGAENLFLVNKRNGKKYKFNLTEVS